MSMLWVEMDGLELVEVEIDDVEALGMIFRSGESGWR
jgi:hypothetical protein